MEKLNETTKPTTSKSQKLQSNSKETNWNWLSWIKSESGLIGIALTILGLIMAVFFWIVPFTIFFEGALETEKPSVKNSNVSTVDLDNFERNSPVTENLKGSNGYDVPSANSSDKIAPSNSNNQKSLVNKPANQMTKPFASKTPEGQDDEGGSFQNNEKEIEVVRPIKKTVALNSPFIYREIREKSLLGTAFEREELIQRLKYLKQLGLTMDFTFSSRAIAQANEWIEICSVLVGQTDVWMNKNSAKSYNRNYFDSAETIRNKNQGIDLMKSVVSLKTTTLDNVIEKFTEDSTKVLSEKKPVRRTYVSLDQIKKINFE